MDYQGSTYMTEERIKLAGEEKRDRLYEPKQNQKAIKVLTVAAYVLCVSLAAIMLSFYYIFIWNSSAKANPLQPRAITCDKIVIPDGLEKLLANASEISLETFLKNYSMRFKLDHEKIKMIQIQEIKHFPHLFERLEHPPNTADPNSNSNSNNKETIDSNNNNLLAATTSIQSDVSVTEPPSTIIPPASTITSLDSSSSSSSLFLSDEPVVSAAGGAVAAPFSAASSFGLIKILKEINQRKDNNYINKQNKQNELEVDDGGDAIVNQNEDDEDDNDDDDDDDNDDDDTEQEDYYEPSGQKEITPETYNKTKNLI